MKGYRSIETAISRVYLREELQGSDLNLCNCELEPLNYYNCNPGTYELYMLWELCITYMKA